MADVVKTKTFKNGGSLAIRIPAGWIEEGEITLRRDSVSGEVIMSQRAANLRALLTELAAGEPIADSVFEEALKRQTTESDLSIFEKQAGRDASA